MSIPAHRANVIGICDYLMENEHTSAFHAHDLQHIPGRIVTNYMMKIMLDEGFLLECRKGYYLRVDHYLR